MAIFSYFKSSLRPGVFGRPMGKKVIMRVAAIICLVGIISTFFPSFCHGAAPRPQRAPVRTKSIDVGYVRNNSNERVSETGSGPGRNRWARVEVVFETFPEYIDQLEVRYYLLCKDRKTVLTGSQTCMYVKKGRSHVTSIYVYPNAVEKYGGEVIGAVVEFYVGGKLVIRTVRDKSKSGRWWEEKPAVRGALTNWQATPFRRTGAHELEALKLE